MLWPGESLPIIYIPPLSRKRLSLSAILLHCASRTVFALGSLTSVDPDLDRTALPLNTAKMPGLTANTQGKYNQIPGPLGLASASLEGKVALVTGAGMCCLTAPDRLEC